MIKKIAKILIGFIGILIILIFIIRGEEVFLETDIRVNSWSDYHKEFVFKYVNIDNDSKEITVYFRYKELLDDAQLDVIKSTYENIFYVFFDDEKNKYYDYQIDIWFQKIPGSQFISVMDITNDKSNVAISSRIGGGLVSVNEVQKICPEVKRLSFSKLVYDSLEEFSGFIDLKSVYCRDCEISFEEQEYILSLFPECEIDWYEKDE